MSQEIRQTVKTEQGLAITPQLKRSLDILQAPALEVEKIIENEIRTNPLLEEVPNEPNPAPEMLGDGGEHEDFESSEEKVPAIPKRERREGISYSGSSLDSDAQEKRDFFISSIPDKISLHEYLLNEAAIDAPTPGSQAAFKELAGFLDERGFLPGDAAELVRGKGFSESDVNAALELLKNCEPAGIGARDMREALMLQLERKGMGNSLAYRILENHFPLLLKRKVEEIAKSENCKADKVEKAISDISKLNTSPAYGFKPEESEAILPDLVFFKDDNGEFDATLYEDYIPKLRINPEYRQMAANGNLDEETEEYIRQKIRDAKSVMDALKQRQATLLKIGLAILSKQLDFFAKGPSALKPMTMQDVADAVELHPTTVGRAISGKYADTPFGIVALKSFFSGGYETDKGQEVASGSVKEKIRQIIDAESPHSPLSDAKVAEMLSRDGLNVARRTVAKYRDELGIAPKALRKRFK